MANGPWQFSANFATGSYGELPPVAVKIVGDADLTALQKLSWALWKVFDEL